MDFPWSKPSRYGNHPFKGKSDALPLVLLTRPGIALRKPPAAQAARESVPDRDQHIHWIPSRLDVGSIRTIRSQEIPSYLPVQSFCGCRNSMSGGFAPLFDSFPRSWRWYQLIAEQYYVCTALHLTFSGLPSLLSRWHPKSISTYNLVISHLCIKPPHLMIISPHWDWCMSRFPPTGTFLVFFLDTLRRNKLLRFFEFVARNPGLWL